jgi:ankyrin repeat protein
MPNGHSSRAERGMEALQELVAAKVDLNQVEPGGRSTALSRLAHAGLVKPAAFLLGNGADVNARDDDGKTALHRATRNSDPDMVRLLLDRNANVTLKDNNGDAANPVVSSDNPQSIIVAGMLLDKIKSELKAVEQVKAVQSSPVKQKPSNPRL